MKFALQLALAYARNPDKWMIFTGAFGSGKTHLAAAIALELKYSGYEVMFTTIPDLMDYLRITFDPKINVRFDKRFQEIRNAPILVLDDLSLASATPWAKEKLFQIVDYRYITKMPTIFTTAQAHGQY